MSVRSSPRHGLPSWEEQCREANAYIPWDLAGVAATLHHRWGSGTFALINAGEEGSGGGKNRCSVEFFRQGSDRDHYCVSNTPLRGSTDTLRRWDTAVDQYGGESRRRLR